MNIKILNVLDFTGCVCTRVCSVYACACVLACEGVVRGWKWGLGSSFGFPPREITGTSPSSFSFSFRLEVAGGGHQAISVLVFRWRQPVPVTAVLATGERSSGT